MPNFIPLTNKLLALVSSILPDGEVKINSLGNDTYELTYTKSSQTVGIIITTSDLSEDDEFHIRMGNVLRNVKESMQAKLDALKAKLDN